MAGQQSPVCPVSACHTTGRRGWLGRICNTRWSPFAADSLPTVVASCGGTSTAAERHSAALHCLQYVLLHAKRELLAGRLASAYRALDKVRGSWCCPLRGSLPAVWRLASH